MRSQQVLSCFWSSLSGSQPEVIEEQGENLKKDLPGTKRWVLSVAVGNISLNNCTLDQETPESAALYRICYTAFKKTWHTLLLFFTANVVFTELGVF